MKKRALFLNLHCSSNYPMAKELERRGFDIIEIYPKDPKRFRSTKRLEVYQNQDFLDEKLSNYYFKPLDKKMEVYFNAKHKINLDGFNLEKYDKFFCFNEQQLFETACIDKTFMSQKQAFSLSAKHVYYRKLNIFYEKIYSKKDFLRLDKKFILKPSVASAGKKYVFKIQSQEDKQNLLKQYPNIFDKKILFLAMPIIENVSEIWAMTLFDNEMRPYILWYSTEKGHATFSPFSEDLFFKIKNIATKLKIKNWMAFLQFIIDSKGELHFIDLNPRLPGDNDWYELLYKYLTGKRFSRVLLDLLLDKKNPKIINTYKYVVEKEYQDKYEGLKNTKVWFYTDSYKEKPILFFKKYS